MTEPQAHLLASDLEGKIRVEEDNLELKAVRKQIEDLLEIELAMKRLFIFEQEMAPQGYQYAFPIEQFN